MTSPWRKTPPAAASTRKCCLAPPPDEVSCGAACKLRGGRGPPCLIRPRPCQAQCGPISTLQRQVSFSPQVIAALPGRRYKMTHHETHTVFLVCTWSGNLGPHVTLHGCSNSGAGGNPELRTGKTGRS